MGQHYYRYLTIHLACKNCDSVSNIREYLERAKADSLNCVTWPPNEQQTINEIYGTRCQGAIDVASSIPPTSPMTDSFFAISSINVGIVVYRAEISNWASLTISKFFNQKVSIHVSMIQKY